MTARDIAEQLVNGNISVAKMAITGTPNTAHTGALTALEVVAILAENDGYTWDNAVSTVRRCLQGYS